MAYIHKKSIRKLTDKQFSRGTAIDASDIDGALGDSVERFNEIPVGDLSTRMTPTQFVFGYTPAPIASQPTVDFDGAGPSFYVVPTAASGRSQNTWVPWLPIVNSKYTSVTVDREADPAVTDGYEAMYSNTFTPTEGFQNKWRIKGTHIEGRGNISNNGHEFSADGASFWGGNQNYSYERQSAVNGYQHAWTNSWQFSKPCIIDDISIMMRTDNTTTGLFDTDWSYADGLDTHGAADFFVVLHVDNPTATEDRSANDVEGHFGNTDVYMARVSMGQTPSGTFSYSEMQPIEPGYSAPSGYGLDGRVVRWRDMNIPIHQGARVRLSLVVPVHRDAAPTPDAGGWSKKNLARHIFIQSMTWTEVNFGPGPLGPFPLPERYLAMHNFSMSGVLTVLEEVQG
tara:strand:+ start:453 stop:1646 length:1194 start_codon:yes stop_codon:yes gene_type:complete